MSDDKNLILADDIPPPLQSLTQEIIHPDNIALEFRMRRAATLKTTKVWALRWERWWLQRKVDLNHWQAERDTYRQIVLQMRELAEHARNIPREDANKEAYQEIRSQYLAKADERRVLGHRLRAAAPAARRLMTINRTLEAWELAQRHAKEEALTKKQLYAEAKIYGSYIRQEWAAREKCHEQIIQKNGRIIKNLPQFEYVDLTAVATWFQVRTSYKGVVGYRRGLPGSVSISDVLDDDVILNIQTACRRPVKKILQPNGAWIVVDRVGVVGGLPEYITYKRMMEFYPEFIRHKFPLCVGVTENARVVYLTLEDYAHFLIAGWTGSGKSNIANVFISTLIAYHSPAEIRIKLIDMKGGLEFGHLEGIPHLLGDVDDKIEQVARTLSRLEKEMEQRFEIMRSRRAKHLSTYNARVSPEKRLPRIAVFFDEVSVLARQGESTRSILGSLLALSSKGRAVGINLFPCTQHPSVDILPGPIKTNMTVRIAGRMPTAASSMTVLGSGAASQLDPVVGRMMLMLGPDPKAIQTPYISDEDIVEAVTRAKAYAPSAYDLPEEGVVHQEWTVQMLVALALQHTDGNVSTSPLQRELKQELSNKQVRDLCNELYAMQTIEHEGVTYRIVKRKAGARYLEPVERPVLEAEIA